MMTNVMVKTGLNQKIMKNSNLVQAMKNSLYVRQRMLPEGRFFPKAEFYEVSELWIQHSTW